MLLIGSKDSDGFRSHEVRRSLEEQQKYQEEVQQMLESQWDAKRRDMNSDAEKLS